MSIRELVLIGCIGMILISDPAEARQQNLYATDLAPSQQEG